MIELSLKTGGSVFINMGSVESIEAGEGSGAELSSIVTLSSGRQHNVLGSPGEIAEKLSPRAPVRVEAVAPKPDRGQPGGQGWMGR